MHTTYPPIKPYATHTLGVEGLHNLYIEECGDPDGIPILVLHGGPGAGCTPEMRTYCDPQVYRIILFDQRGCGRSTPLGELNDNNTQALLEDIEKIRELLGIDRWLILGGSWGTTLALVYAQAHVERVMGMILRGVFLGRISDIGWFYKNGAELFFPDYWEDFMRPINNDEQIIPAYYQKLTGNDELARLSAAKAWATWEARCATLQPHASIIESFTEPYKALSLARIECHYFLNHCFLEDQQILDNMDKISHLPCIIVHGRYDIICPLENAWTLNKAWPGSDLYIVRDAGHAASEPGITDALIHATKKMAKECKQNA